MKFQIGDKVLILHSNEEGEVVDIINNKMVMVDVRGVKFPAYTDQLDFPYFKRFSEKKLFPQQQPKKFIDEIPKEKKNIPEKKPDDGIWLIFIPVMDSDEFGDEMVSELKIHLVNKTQAGYQFTYTLTYTGPQSGFDLSNQIRSFEDFYIHDIPFENFNDNPLFSFELSLLNPDKKKADYFTTSLKIKPKQIFSRIEELKKKGEASFSYKLMDTYPGRSEQVITEQVSEPISANRIYEVSQARRNMEPARYEVDLHIEKLAEDWKSLNNFEMLILQLKTFEKYLELAIAHRQHALIAIHGVGSGKLRDEIHEILRLRKEVKNFVNQYHPAYGYGATEIYLQY